MLSIMLLSVGRTPCCCAACCSGHAVGAAASFVPSASSIGLLLCLLLVNLLASSAGTVAAAAVAVEKRARGKGPSLKYPTSHRVHCIGLARVTPYPAAQHMTHMKQNECVTGSAKGCVHAAHGASKPLNKGRLGMTPQ